jgi:hypothetical protein
VILSPLLVAGITFRRLVGPRQLLLAAVGGCLAGLLVLGLPSPSLVRPVFVLLVSSVSALLVLPMVASLPTGDRRGGYEQLQGLRPIRSLGWCLGRLQGSVVAAALLTLVVHFVASQVARLRPMPHWITGRAEVSADEGQLWRFGIPAGVAGPFDLAVDSLLPFAGSGTLEVTVRRGGGELRLSLPILPVRRHVLVVPDLAPLRGDLYISLEGRQGVILGERPPELSVGTGPLAASELELPLEVLEKLGFALLVVLGAAHLFRFETTCLAGLLALGISPPEAAWSWALAVTALVAFGTAGSALSRRQALP